VEAARDLPLVVRDGRRVLSLRRADLRHEVWQLDLRRVSGGVDWVGWEEGVSGMRGIWAKKVPPYIVLALIHVVDDPPNVSRAQLERRRRRRRMSIS
jgi:hypothetical protein